MKLYLNHHPKKAEKGIHHAESLFFIGSCFSEHIYSKLLTAGFGAYSNPAGIVFNPLSVFSELQAIVTNSSVNPDFFIERDKLYFSLQAHSSLHADSSLELSNVLNAKRSAAKQHLTECSHLFITLGTAWYYKHTTLNAVVANCQKLPAASFTKHLLSVSEICEQAKQTIAMLNSLNPKLQLVFTVSPVRHLRDGLEENYLSKSIVRTAIHGICSANKNCSYFAAYELVNDDLKDYRFYEQDLAHPDQKAIDYVWEKFTDCHFSATTKELAQLFEKRAKLLNHRPQQNSETNTQTQNLYLAQINAQITQLLSNEKQSK